MPTVDNHIAHLLQEHDCVIIPGFGGLITQYHSVRIHPVRNSMAPPSKKVAFNEKLQLSDGRLVNYISLQEHLSEADATTRVQAFVTSVNLALEQHRRYQLHEIGLFRKEPGQPIAFEYEERINLLAESFGLPEVFSKPVLRGRSLAEIKTAVQEKVAIPLHSEVREVQGKPVWKKALRYAAMLPVLLLSASAIYLATTLDNDFSMSNLNPVSLLFTETETVSGFNYSEKTVLVPASSAIITDLEREAYYSILMPAHQEDASYLTDQYLLQQPEEPIIEVTPEEISEAISANAAKDVNRAKPAESISEPVAAEKPIAKPAITKATENTSSHSSIIGDKTGKFYIIAGGFLNADNAKKLQKKIITNGEVSKIILPGKESRLNRVTVGEFDSKQEAINKISELTADHGKALWVLEY